MYKYKLMLIADGKLEQGGSFLGLELLNYCSSLREKKAPKKA